ncbi:MAG: hypothetical protein R6W78_09200 [Bacteroidales bacterium]
MLQHIALTINNPEEIENFYEGVLLFNNKNKYSLSEENSLNIFNLKGSTDVFFMNHQNTDFELFVCEEKENKLFAHVCLAYWKAEITYHNALDRGYKTYVKQNVSHNTYFIWDKSGNMFEIKDII